MNQVPSCLCHIINATKTPLLLWKHNEKQWILKIADQKFLGHPRLDKRGTVYWKFRNWEEEIPLPKSEPSPSGPAAVASIEKGEVKIEENVNKSTNSTGSTQPLNSDRSNAPE
jgi:hypothetical protein